MEVVCLVLSGIDDRLPLPYVAPPIAWILLGMGLEFDDVLLDWQVALTEWIHPDQLVAFARHVERLAHCPGEKSDLVGPESGDDAAVLDDAFCANDHRVDCGSERVRDSCFWDCGDWDGERPERGDGHVAARGVFARGRQDVDDVEVAPCFCGVAE